MSSSSSSANIFLEGLLVNSGLVETLGASTGFGGATTGLNP
jgi:hypothetical protein